MFSKTAALGRLVVGCQIYCLSKLLLIREICLQNLCGASGRNSLQKRTLFFRWRRQAGGGRRLYRPLGQHDKNLQVIDQHLIYKPIYEHFTASFESIDALLVYGYSYRDAHVNKIIKQAIDTYPFQVINVNPYTPFPFRRNCSSVNIENAESIEEVKLG